MQRWQRRVQRWLRRALNSGCNDHLQDLRREVKRLLSYVVSDFSSIIRLFITSAFEDLKCRPACLSAPRSSTQLPKFSNKPGAVTLVSGTFCVFNYFSKMWLSVDVLLDRKSDREGQKMTCNSGLSCTWAQKSSSVPLISLLPVTAWLQFISPFRSNSEQLKFLHTDLLPSSWFAWVLSSLVKNIKCFYPLTSRSLSHLVLVSLT